MPDFGTIGATSYETAGATTASSTGTAVADTGTNTKGSWTQLIASTAYPASWLYVVINNPSPADSFLVDIGVGAAASEQVVVDNLMYCSISPNGLLSYPYLIPLSIPAGSRIAARCQSDSSGADSVVVMAHVISSGMMDAPTMGIVTTMGATTASSTGTAVDPGGTANTKGSYVEFASSSTYPIRWLLIALGTTTVSYSAEMEWLVDVAVGGAGSEQVVIANLYIAGSTIGDLPSPTVLALPVLIPAGSRISARCQCSVNTAAERVLDVIMYGVS